MKNRFFSGCIIALFWALASCDIVQPPYLEQNSRQLPPDSACLVLAQRTDPFGAGTAPLVKKVLLEEYTGHKCGNCPSATRVAVRLAYQDHPGRVFLLSIHAGPLALPEPGSPKFSTNFTTPEGNALYETINKAFYDAVPAGFFDRKLRGLGAGTWPARVASQLAEPVEAGIRLHACYQPDSRNFSIVTDVRYLVGGMENDFLAVYLSEDSVLDWQKDYDPGLPSQDIPNYLHRDVFRGAVNGVWGERLTTAPVLPGQRFTRLHSSSLPDHMDPRKTYLLVFIYDQATGYLRQVERIRL